jgi:hypothetical protein
MTEGMPMGLVLRLLLPCALVLAVGSVSSRARADIRRPGSHPDIELSPHLVLQWADEPAWDGDGIGVGMHAAIPVIPQGPVTTINNSLAIGFGLDWAHFDDACGPWAVNPGFDCSGDDFWLPVTVQWNFFFTDLISAFPELGLAIEHERWDDIPCGPGNNWYWCGDNDDTELELVLWLGVRFHLAQAFAITIKLGTPSLLLGVSFFL